MSFAGVGKGRNRMRPPSIARNPDTSAALRKSLTVWPVTYISIGVGSASIGAMASAESAPVTAHRMPLMPLPPGFDHTLSVVAPGP